MHEGKKEAREQQSPDGIAESLLEKPPEIDLLGQGDAYQLVDHRRYRQQGEDPSRGRSNEPERRQHNQRYDDARSDVPHPEFKADLLLQEKGDGEEEDGNEILEKREGKGMIYKYQSKKRRVCV